MKKIILAFIPLLLLVGCGADKKRTLPILLKISSQVLTLPPQHLPLVLLRILSHQVNSQKVIL